MIRILFICHGNICRSTAAECVLKHMTSDMPDILIDSAATTNEEIGNPIYSPMKKALNRAGIPVCPHRARKVTRKDYDFYDYLICMDRENLEDLNWMFSDPEQKISMLMDWAGKPGIEVPDPWYTRDFDGCLEQIVIACRGIYDTITSSPQTGKTR